MFLTNIGELTTNDGPTVSDAAVAIEDDTIVYAGPSGDAPSPKGELIDCEGAAVLPGFVDAHTHLVFAGDRSGEFARRLAGESYAQIAESGGGILSTVEATRNASEEYLYEKAAARAWRMIGAGTTTIEIKSGYGLDVDTELKILRVAGRIAGSLPLTVKRTFLGAHSIPGEYRDDREGYLELLTEEMLPAAAPHADYCDVFVEDGVFDVDEARQIFSTAEALGLKARVHAEQLTHSGGAALAAEIGAASADHLDHVTVDDARGLADSGVSAVLVPGASYTLKSPPAPGPMLIDAGCDVAIATDCNPGTSYFESMSPIISLAVVQMGLTVEQAIRAATLGGARSLGTEDRGVLVPGAKADIIVLDAPSVAHIPYRPATQLVRVVIKDGRPVG
jgi:imidazolonepropionase